MEKVRVGVIGTGWRSEMLHCLQASNAAEIVGIADINPERLTWYQQNVSHAAYTTTDYRTLLERQDIDAVFVMTPDYLHEEHALAALQHGKYVYLEKPMATSIEGCDKILRAQSVYNKKVMIGFNMRYMAMFQTMKNILDRGDIGEIKAVWIRHFVGRGGDYYFHDWHGVQKYTNSLLLQKASHDIDVMHWLTGRYVNRVAGFGGLDYFGGSHANDLRCPDCDAKDTCWEYNEQPRTQCAFRSDIDVEDNQVMIMELEGGIKASYLQCHFTPDYQRNYTIIGTEGRIENSEPESIVRVKYRRNVPIKGLTDVDYLVQPENEHASADERIVSQFLQMVLSDGNPPVNPLDGRMSVAVGVKAAESIRCGGTVKAIPAVDSQIEIG